MKGLGRTLNNEVNTVLTARPNIQVLALRERNRWQVKSTEKRWYVAF